MAGGVTGPRTVNKLGGPVIPGRLVHTGGMIYKPCIYDDLFTLRIMIYKPYIYDDLFTLGRMIYKHIHLRRLVHTGANDL